MLFFFPIVTVKSSIEDMCLVQGKEQKISENCLAVFSWTVWPLKRSSYRPSVCK